MRPSLLAFAGLSIIGLVSLGGTTAPDDAVSDEELRRLMRERYEAATAEMTARTEIYKTGRELLTDACDSIRRFSTAGLEVARTPDYRLKLCEHAFDRAKTIEDSVRAKHETNAEPTQAMKLATFTRLDMEIKLHEARKAQLAEKARHAEKARPKADDSDLPELLSPGAKSSTST